VVQSTGAIVVGHVDLIAVHYLHQVGPVNPSRANALYRLQVRAAGVLKRLGERICYPRSGAFAFICVSDGVASELREHFPALADRVLTIHNGVDTDGFAPGARAADAGALRERLEIPGEASVALFVGSEWHRKGLETVLRALAETTGWFLTVAGDGDVARYTAMADELGIGERVRWLGVVADVAPLYELCDAFVLPSSYETFSLVSFEAAASGVPVLATPVSGVRELIEDGRNGFVIDREPATVARRLRELRDDPELARRLGAAARESALEFSWARMLARHRELYARVADAQ
jgi:UDP-glucose:(heptosyl)LPS alpha-1,3-glucosyltransferase